MPEEYSCQSKSEPCDPRDCNVEICYFRDVIWAKRQMQSWAYDTDYRKPKDRIDNPNDNKSKTG